MKYNNRAIMAMIASAIDPKRSDADGDHIRHRREIAEVETSSDGNALMLYMADGRVFQVSVMEVV